jgi:hypothetical protein
MWQSWCTRDTVGEISGVARRAGRRGNRRGRRVRAILASPPVEVSSLVACSASLLLVQSSLNSETIHCDVYLVL